MDDRGETFVAQRGKARDDHVAIATHAVEAAIDRSRNGDVAIGGDRHGGPLRAARRAEAALPHDRAFAVHLGQEQILRPARPVGLKIAVRGADGITEARCIRRDRLCRRIRLHRTGRHHRRRGHPRDRLQRGRLDVGELGAVGRGLIDASDRRERLARHVARQVVDPQELRHGRCIERGLAAGDDERIGRADLIDRHTLGPIGGLHRKSPFVGFLVGHEMHQPARAGIAVLVDHHRSVRIAQRDRVDRSIDRGRDGIERRRLRSLGEIDHDGIARPRLIERDAKHLIPTQARQR